MWLIVKEWFQYTFGSLFSYFSGFFEYLDKVMVFWTFLAIGLVSGGFLILTMVLGEVSEIFSDIFGGDHDFDHGVDHDTGVDGDQDVADHDFDHTGSDAAGISSPSFLSFRILLSFFSGFGVTGAIATYLKEPVIMSSIYGLGVGAIMMILTYLFVLFLSSQQASVNISTAELVGKEGYVTVDIPANGFGQVMINTEVGSISKLASSTDGPIPEKSFVRVNKILSDILLVSTVNRTET